MDPTEVVGQVIEIPARTTGDRSREQGGVRDGRREDSREGVGLGTQMGGEVGGHTVILAPALCRCAR